MIRQRIPAITLLLMILLLTGGLLIGLSASPAQAQNACEFTIGAVNNLTADCRIAGVTIDADTTLNGNGHTVTAEAGKQIMVENGAALTLVNVALSGNDVPADATLFNIIGGTVTIEHSVISDNSAASGSTLFNVIGGTLYAENSVFKNNTAASHGGLFNLIDSQLTVTNSVISENNGAVFNIIGGTMTVRDSIVDEIADANTADAFNIVGSTMNVSPMQTEPVNAGLVVDDETETVAVEAADCQITTDYNVNLRTAPGNNNILAVIPYQTTLTTTAEENGWYQVEWEGQPGWLDSAYVTADCP